MAEQTGYTEIKVKLRYGDGGYGEFPYKNEWKYISPIPPITLIEDDVEDWLIDQYKEDYLNG